MRAYFANYNVIIIFDWEVTYLLINLLCIQLNVKSNHLVPFIFQSYPNKKFIACQGPKGNPDNTIAEFWQMVMENKVTHIVMISKFIESGKVWFI